LYIPSFEVKLTTDKQNSKIKIQVCSKLKVGDGKTVWQLYVTEEE
jgi:hypothetical protein